MTTEMVIAHDEDVIELAQSCRGYASLSHAQKKLLRALIDDFVSGNIHTNEDLAEKAGISTRNVYYCKKNPVFIQVLSEILPDLAKTRSIDVLEKIYKQIERDWQAGKWWLQFTGQWIPSSKQAVLHARTQDFADTGTESSATAQFLIKLGQLGWSEERLVALWRELKAEGAW